MKRIGYVIFFVVVNAVFISINFFLYEVKMDLKLVIMSLLASFLSLLFVYFLQKKQSKTII